MSTYAWIIDKDLIADEGVEAPSNQNAVGMMGPRDISPEQEAALQAGQGSVFRMLDSDGEVYYRGRLLGDQNDEEGFAPLYDFGQPNAGASDIQYSTGTEVQEGWRSL